MKTASPTDRIDVQALRVGMFVHLDIGWMSHPFPLSSFRITTRGAAGDDPLARPAHGALEPAARAISRRTRRRPRRAALPAARAAGDAANDSGLGATLDAIDTVPYMLPVDDSVGRRAPAHARKRGPGRARRGSSLRQRDAPRALRAPVRRGGARLPRTRSTWFRASRSEARAQAESLSRAIVDKMVGEQDLCIRMLAEGAGDKASMHAMNVAIISLLMGRCFGFNDEEMQDLGVGAMLHDVGKIELPPRLRHREDNFSPNEAARLRGARRDGPGAGAAHGPVGRARRR